MPLQTMAPLLLCQVCGYWRDLAICNAHLWSSLSTEVTCSPELIELWLHRAGARSLSLRIDRALSHPQTDLPIHPPLLLHEFNYSSLIPLHLSLIVPKLHQCRQLELLNWPSPQDIVAIPESFPALESLSVTLRSSDMGMALPAANLLSNLFAHAPGLRQLHLNGPHISIHWNQLQFLSWCPHDMEVFRATMPNLIGITCLRLQFPHGFFDDAVALPEPYVCPNVTEFFLHGNVAGLGTIVLPQLRNLVLEDLYSQSEAEEDTALVLLLERSLCAIEIFEIHGGASNFFPALQLLHRSIAPTLTHLLISSHKLDFFFRGLERAVPDTLSQDMRLLRAVDRCF
ncbi:hypothetical protein K438DRAFT_2101788 [Mycena galopus ATCC 62051]|nr:hypothetical protein K438DRAFT_2101788 [Mycena galopus ATCC 62051]